MKKFLGFTFLICLLLIIMVYIIVYNILTFTYGKKMDDKNIIDIFNKNKQLFEQINSSLVDTNILSISKDSVNSYQIILDNKETIKFYIDDVSSENEKYKDYITFMGKLNIIDISSYNKNVSFLINSMFGCGQYISFVYDMEEYKQNYPIEIIKNIDEKWYYIETD